MTPATTPARVGLEGRVSAIDALRGAVMILMALDHVRDLFHIGAMSFSPTDLTRTTPLLFLTRWITHFCMPVFMFTAGAGAFLWMRNGHSKARLSRFLLTRGVWLIVLELTVMQFAYNFNFSVQLPVFLLVLWIFGICMIVMAALIHLPVGWLTSVAIFVVARNQPGPLTFFRNQIIAPYPLIPWVAVMAAGFCFGHVLLRGPVRRRRITVGLGTAMTAGFVLIRLMNSYGDPAPWTQQKTFVWTLLSFLNCTKYPASPDFLLMTLGPALLLLAALTRWSFKPRNPLLVFGKVPLFFFIAHFYLIHALLVLLTCFRYGPHALTFIFNRVPSMGGPQKLFPTDFGYSLPAVYCVWIVVLVILYPLCRWFGVVKASRRHWWLTYL